MSSACTKRLVVILNDNEWSIARNVGAMAHYLNRLSTSPTYNKIHHDLEKFFTGLPHGHDMNRLWMKWKRETKDFFVGSSLFEKFGLRYLGPIDGHNLDELAKNLEFAKQCDSPILLHVLTKKGHGLEAALNSPEKFHGVGAFDPATGESRKPAAAGSPAYQDVFGQAMVRFARADPRVVGITGAMPSGTGLSRLAAEIPKQFFDVGIAEEHAVLFAAGLAARGMRPVCAIYSTFLQRAYDPIIHDVALQNLPVTFCLDRAGLSPNDGATHHGVFDLAYLRCVPGAVVMQPKDEDELVDMLHTSLQLDGPAFIRYPRGAGPGARVKDQPAALAVGHAEVLREGSNIMIWALGPFVATALRLAARLAEEEAFGRRRQRALCEAARSHAAAQPGGRGAADGDDGGPCPRRRIRGRRPRGAPGRRLHDPGRAHRLARRFHRAREQRRDTPRRPRPLPRRHPSPRPRPLAEHQRPGRRRRGLSRIIPRAAGRPRRKSPPGS